MIDMVLWQCYDNYNIRKATTEKSSLQRSSQRERHLVEAVSVKCRGKPFPSRIAESIS